LPLVEQYRSTIAGLEEPEQQSHQIGYAIRDFARQHPILFRVMAQVRMEADDEAFKAIVHEIANFYANALSRYNYLDSVMIQTPNQYIQVTGMLETIELRFS